MSKNKIEVLERDDEIIREQGMTSGPVKSCGFELRTTAVREVSWMERNGVSGESDMGVFWKTCAFAFIHSEPLPLVRSVVNDREAFIEKIDDWMDAHKLKASEIQTLAAEMNSRIMAYYSSSSSPAESGPASGN